VYRFCTREIDVLLAVGERIQGRSASLARRSQSKVSKTNRAVLLNKPFNKTSTMKKSAQRDANTELALVVVRFGHHPPARCRRPTDRTDYNTLRRSITVLVFVSSFNASVFELRKFSTYVSASEIKLDFLSVLSVNYFQFPFPPVVCFYFRLLIV